jgi:hypothetical protein
MVCRLSVSERNSLWRTFQTTPESPANLAANPPTRSAWYIQVWITQGDDFRSHPARRSK